MKALEEKAKQTRDTGTDHVMLQGPTHRGAGRGHLRPHRELLGRDLEILHCPHQASSAGVWCCKAMPGMAPGMAVALIERHRLDRDRCVVVGDLETDRELAELAGMSTCRRSL